MSDQDTQTLNSREAQKTVIAFIAGLLIGGLLVWIFGGSPAESPTMDDTENGDTTTEVTDTEDTDTTDNEDATSSDETADEDTEMATGEGSVNVSNQPAGSTVQIEGAVFPTDEGWIGVRDYQNGQMGSILGVARYSKTEGLTQDSIRLLRATSAGNEYAVVFYSENGDHEFNLATDTQIDGVFETFTAQ